MHQDHRALINLARAASAGEGGVSSLVPRLCASLAESFSLGRVEIVLAGEDDAAFAAAREAGHAVVSGGRLVVPLAAADRVVGFLITDDVGLLREVDLSTVAAAGDRAPEVKLDIPDGLCALVDPTAFDRIVGNLVTNALRYGRSPISVRAVQNDRHFRLSVEDHGDGVPPGFVPKLFERFSRGEGSYERGGSGLGLSIAQAYAQAHGGQVFYEDASPHGARFQLVLPSQS
jgi:signal transduction histidine kinase